MAFELPNLPFDAGSFEGWTSAETFSFHHGKHHAGYVKKLNAATEGTEWADKDLVEVINGNRGNAGIFNSAAQHWNHSFFWNSLSPDAQTPEGQIAELIDRDFGSLDTFKEQFGEMSLKLFGSGWAWLVQNAEGKLGLAPTKDADTPVGTDVTPILTLDVWEHAYYVDFRNDRGKFIEGFWNHVNWKHAGEQLN